MANQWLTGEGTPSTGIGQVTDYYRDTVNNLVYYRENAFTWTVVPAFTPNPDGIGTTWLHGDVPPLTGQGSDGDYYYDEVQLIVYRKDGATWVPKGSLDFIGIYGVQWGNGIGAPASTVPLNALPAGSFYLNVETSDIYYKEPSMSWVLKGQLGGGGGGGSSVTVEDVLNSTSTVNALSANQGRVLNTDKAPLASPTFTGTPTAPTPQTEPSLDNSTKLATTEFVNVVANAAKIQSIVAAASDETTALTTGTSKVTFRMPYAFTLTSVRASLTTAQASGSVFTVDINDNGTTILSTKLTIDNTEKTSTTAATAAVISDTSLADDAEITIDIDQVGDGTAKGLKITLIGTRA